MNIADLHVLVIEDDDFQRKIMVRMLASLGVASIVEASNGKQALDEIHRATPRPNIALCDLDMPEMDGMEFLRHLGEEKLTIPVILTSALDSKLLSSISRMTRLYGIHLLGTIEKPVNPVNLKSLLSKHGPAPVRQQSAADSTFSLEDILAAVDADQFEPYFQPKVDLRTGSLVGAEALARWKHPHHGVTGPAAFIPLLESSGNIDKLTFQILDKAAMACRRCHDHGHVMPVSVNLSLVSLDDTSLADHVMQIVRRSGLDPRYLILEITESAAMTDVAPALENLARLCMHGFPLSIDDYGTGSSNLQQLARIAFSELKIDQSFVQDFSENSSLRVIVESSIDMARKLNVKSVGEGVETRQDWDMLRRLGCDIAQGYFIARPMDLDTFTAFVKGYQPGLMVAKS